MQSPAPASSLAKPPPAASPQLGRWICQQGLRSARMRCLLLVLAAARVLLLCCCCCCCCCAAAATASTTTALAFLRLVTFRTGMIVLELAMYLFSIYLSTMQFSAPASSLAEPPPAASPQLGRWICQQELRSARSRGLLLVLAAASAAAAASTTTTALAFYVWSQSYWYDRIIILLLLRLQPARDSRHTVCLGTSS